MLRRALLRWLLPDQVYVGARIYPATSRVALDVYDAHTDFDGANEDLAGRGGSVHVVRLVVD